MKRRDLLRTLTTAILGIGLAPDAFAAALKAAHRQTVPRPAGDRLDDHVRDYLYKLRHFYEPHPDDIWLEKTKLPLLEQSLRRLRRIERTIGHGHFQLLDFDGALKAAANFSDIGAFSKTETDFLEMIFYSDAAVYGFFGEKPLKHLTDRIPTREVTKVPYTGNHLYRGQPVETYEKIRRELGDKVILTSGVRSVMKQFLLFLNKAHESRGNLSLASRSLAPPGFSYHGVGDFDVGQVGLGADNFTERFVSTDVYRELKERGYLTLRYSRDNLLGVRYEPWHIKMDRPSV